MDKEVKRWITINGRHVPIYEEYKEWTDADAKREYSKYDYDVTSKEWRNDTM